MSEIRIVHCPAAMPCDICGKVVVPGEAHRCEAPKVRIDRLNRKQARRAGMTDVDASGSWGPAVRAIEDRR